MHFKFFFFWFRFAREGCNIWSVRHPLNCHQPVGFRGAGVIVQSGPCKSTQNFRRGGRVPDWMPDARHAVRHAACTFPTTNHVPSRAGFDATVQSTVNEVAAADGGPSPCHYCTFVCCIILFASSIRYSVGLLSLLFSFALQ